MSNPVIKSGQSSFEKQIHSGRTFVGSKHLEIIAQSVISMAHSYTIMPIVSKEGGIITAFVYCTS